MIREHAYTYTSSFLMTLHNESFSGKHARAHGPNTYRGMCASCHLVFGAFEKSRVGKYVTNSSLRQRHTGSSRLRRACQFVLFEEDKTKTGGPNMCTHALVIVRLVARNYANTGANKSPTYSYSPMQKTNKNISENRGQISKWPLWACACRHRLTVSMAAMTQPRVSRTFKRLYQHVHPVLGKKRLGIFHTRRQLQV